MLKESLVCFKSPRSPHSDAFRVPFSTLQWFLRSIWVPRPPSHHVTPCHTCGPLTVRGLFFDPIYFSGSLTPGPGAPPEMFPDTLPMFQDTLRIDVSAPDPPESRRGWRDRWDEGGERGRSAGAFHHSDRRVGVAATR